MSFSLNITLPVQFIEELLITLPCVHEVCMKRSYTAFEHIFINYQIPFLDVKKKKKSIQSLQMEILGTAVGRIMAAPKMSMS